MSTEDTTAPHADTAEKATNRDANPQPTQRTGPAPKKQIDGWLQRKVEKKIFGKAPWARYFAVLQPELWSMRFYKTELDYFNGEDVGETSVQHLKDVGLLEGRKDGRRFNLIAFDGTESCFLTDTAEEAERWVRALEPFKAKLPRMSISTSRSYTDVFDDTAPKPVEDEKGANGAPDRRHRPSIIQKQRRFTDALGPLTQLKADPKSPSTEETQTPSNSSTVRKSKFVITASRDGTAFKTPVLAVIDRTTRTSHITWTFSLHSHPFKVELWHGRVWGSRKICINGNQVHYTARKLMDNGSRHMIEMLGFKMDIVIVSKGFKGYSYALVSSGSKRTEKAEISSAKFDEVEEKDSAGEGKLSSDDITQIMITYLLDNLQPYVMAHKSVAIKCFEEFLFKAYPPLREEHVREILCGKDMKGRGLLETVGNKQTFSKQLKASAGLAIDFILRLLDPKQCPAAALVNQVFNELDTKYFLSMSLGRHVNGKGGNRKGSLKLIRYIKEKRPDVPIEIPVGKDSGNAIQPDAPVVTRRSSVVMSLNSTDAAAFAKPMSPTEALEFLKNSSILQNKAKKGSIMGADGPLLQRSRSATIDTATSPKADKKPSKSSSLKSLFGFGKKDVKPSVDSAEASSKSTLFGGELLDIMKSAGFDEASAPTVIHPFLAECCSILERKGIHVEGIFRVAGNANHIQKSKVKLNNGEAVDMESLHINVVAELLKLWLRDLAEPIFTFDLYQNFLDSQSASDDELRIKQLQTWIGRLPAVNRLVIAYVFAFLVRMATGHDVSRMNLKNLAMVFGPNLFRPRVESFKTVVADAPIVVSVVLTMLSNYTGLFGDYGFPVTMDGTSDGVPPAEEEVVPEAKANSSEHAESESEIDEDSVFEESVFDGSRESINVDDDARPRSNSSDAARSHVRSISARELLRLQKQGAAEVSDEEGPDAEDAEDAEADTNNEDDATTDGDGAITTEQST